MNFRKHTQHTVYTKKSERTHSYAHIELITWLHIALLELTLPIVCLFNCKFSHCLDCDAIGYSYEATWDFSASYTESDVTIIIRSHRCLQIIINLISLRVFGHCKSSNARCRLSVKFIIVLLQDILPTVKSKSLSNGGQWEDKSTHHSSKRSSFCTVVRYQGQHTTAIMIV